MIKRLILILILFVVPAYADDTTTVERTYNITDCNWMDEQLVSDNNGSEARVRIGVYSPGIPPFEAIGLMSTTPAIEINITDSLNLADSIICCSLIVHLDAITGSMASGDSIYVRPLKGRFSEGFSYFNRRKVDTNWTTAGAKSAGNDYYATPVLAISPADTNASGWYRIDVTDQAEAMMDNDTSFGGWVFQPKTVSGGDEDYLDLSSDDDGEAQRPSLYIKYMIVTVATVGTENRHGTPNKHGAYLH